MSGVEVDSTVVHYLQKKSMRRQVFMEPIYLEFREKLVGNEDESARPASLADVPPIALLLTALVQLVA